MDDGELWKWSGPHLHWSLSNRWFVRFAIRKSQNYKYKQIKKKKTEQTRHSFSISFPDFSHSF